MIINHNMASLNTYRQMSINEKNTSNSLEKLSSGLRINKAGDDAAGLAISEKMRGQIRGLDQAGRNAQDGISLLQTAEGALNETHSILQRMRELAVQSGNDTATADDRKQIQGEVDQLSEEITRISNTTQFNTKKLLNGAIDDNAAGKLTFQIGANTGQSMSVAIGAMDAQSLGVARTATSASVSTSANSAKVATAEGDIGIDTGDKLAIGDYTVTVATTAAGTHTETKSTGATTTIAAGFVTGTAAHDTDITLTYSDGSSNTAATIAATSVGAVAADKLAIDFGTAAGATANGVKIVVDGNSSNTSGAVTASWDGTNNEIHIQLDSTAGNNKEGGIESAIQALGTKTKADGTTLDLSNVTVAGSGDYDSAGAGVDATAVTADASTAAAASGVGAAAGWTATGDKTGAMSGATNPVNGLNIDMSKLSGQSNGDTITIKGYKDATSTAQLYDSAGTTKIGSAVTIDKANGGTYTIGDTTTGKMSVTFDPGKAQDGSTTVTIANTASKAATFSNGQVSAEAVSAGGIDVSTQGAANAAITVLDNAIQKVSDQRSKLGAVENRLDHTINNLGTSSENLTAAESRIRDVDMAKEMMNFQKNNILNQAAQAMLAQANQQPQGVLQLLR